MCFFRGHQVQEERAFEREAFLAVRDKLDPGRVFANDYTRQVLGA